MLSEKEKYEWLSAHNQSYGSTNHGKPYIPYILNNCNIKFPLLDIGCGRNNFIECIKKETNHTVTAIGIDFAFKEADIVCDAQDIPIIDNYFNTIVSFDFFEHLLPDSIDNVIIEIIRVVRTGSKFFATISNVDSVNRGPNGETLHPTVRSIDWWLNIFKQHNFSISRHSSGLYEGIIYK